MKITKSGAFALFTTTLLAVILFSNCTQSAKEIKCCEGYTGELKDSLAIKLKRTCHFIDKDSILAWTNRYQESKKRSAADTQKNLMGITGTNFLLGDSSSFNSCIIKKIICDERCIGLRVIYGMSADKLIHVIFVGINPDYSSLYIKEPEECCNNNVQQMQAVPAATGPGKLGGAEYGQLP